MFVCEDVCVFACLCVCVYVCIPEAVHDGIEGQAISPAGGEIENVDIVMVTCDIPHPAQQELLAIGLMERGHHIFHHVLHLTG